MILIHLHISTNRYLIVIDDIWSTETWDIIKSALPLNHSGSRVITTTRKKSVAESCCSHWNDYVYNLKPLSEMDSKELFFRRIFGSSDRCPPHLEDVSHKILKKCSGLPLAITAMSGLLSNKQYTGSIWEDVYKSLSGIPESIEGAQDIFLISYYGLPYHLKACLLYLSVFPEDYVISRDLIISLWIAEGFILGNRGRTPEEVGQSYLDELINRKMIQPLHGIHDGKPKAYILHGMVLDFVKSKAAEENFVTILENEEPVSGLPDKIRRVSIINNDKDHDIPASMAKSHIRALSIFGSVGPKLSFKKMTVLRVFHLEGCKNLEDRSIKEIAGLVNLRHLSIRDTPITQLPDQIGELQHLTTLDVRGTEVKELPVSVGSLQRLTHLHCDKMRLPEWIGKMVALSCLLQFDIFQSKILAVQELGKLSELKHLVLWWSPDLLSDNTERYEYFATSLYRLNKLQSLAIHGSDTSVDILDYLRHRLWHLHKIHVNSSCYLNRIAEWLGSLPRLEYICIDIKEVANKDLILLSQLPTLTHLSLSSKAMPTEKLVVSSSGFPVLQEFQLHSAKADLTFESQAMQKLEILLLSLHVLPAEKCDFSIKIDQFTGLKKFDLRINGKGAAASQFFADADVAIKKAADGHPNRPTVNVLLFGNLIDYATKQGKENEQKLEPIEEIQMA